MKEYKMLAPQIQEYTGVYTTDTYRHEVTEDDGSKHIDEIDSETHEVINTTNI